MELEMLVVALLVKKFFSEELLPYSQKVKTIGS